MDQFICIHFSAHRKKTMQIVSGHAGFWLKQGRADALVKLTHTVLVIERQEIAISRQPDIKRWARRLISRGPNPEVVQLFAMPELI
jgi:hypothetical protein